MESIAKLMEAASTLLWPLIVIAIVVVFRPAVASLLQSARSRKFTIKIGGQELTMDEASEQQRSLISDLQAQLVDLRKRIEGAQLLPASVQAMAGQAAIHEPSSILWVDDYPKNNSYFVEQLQQLGINIDLALTTAEALSKFSRKRYSVVISDMGRHEDGRENPKAGLDLLKAIRAQNSQIPFVIFCSSRRVREYGAEAKRLGATGITSSPTDLYGLLNLDELKKA